MLLFQGHGMLFIHTKSNLGSTHLMVTFSDKKFSLSRIPCLKVLLGFGLLFKSF